jgi:hypothetical protein
VQFLDCLNGRIRYGTREKMNSSISVDLGERESSVKEGSWSCRRFTSRTCRCSACENACVCCVSVVSKPTLVLMR